MHQNGVVVPRVVGGPSVANVCHGQVFSTGTGEPVKGSGDRVWSVGI